MPDVTEFISRGIGFGWCFAFVWHFLIGCMFAWTQDIEESV
jgi:hypothetical protein